jgi:hypothetical protein
MVSLEFFIDTILPVTLWSWDWLSLYQKWVPDIFPGGKGGRCVRLKPNHRHGTIVLKSGSLNLLEPWGSVQACIGIALPFFVSLNSCSRLRSACGNVSKFPTPHPQDPVLLSAAYTRNCAPCQKCKPTRRLVSVKRSISRPIFEVSAVSKAIRNKVLILGTSTVLPPPGVRSEKKTERDRYIEENVSPD